MLLATVIKLVLLGVVWRRLLLKLERISMRLLLLLFLSIGLGGTDGFISHAKVFQSELCCTGCFLCNIVGGWGYHLRNLDEGTLRGSSRCGVRFL